MTKPYSAPAFLTELLHARSPSGAEFEAQAVFDRHVSPAADTYAKDALGNRIATFNPKGDPVLMLAGHMDELGRSVTFVNPEGFLYFDTIGGHDRTVISGRRVIIRTARGPVKGVTGKRAIHLMDEADRKKVPEIHEIWIDIGARNKAEALARVGIGDTATYDHEFELLHGSIGAARAFDNKVGAYIVGETLIRLAQAKKKCAAKVVAVATAQEEIGVRGATTAVYAVNPPSRAGGRRGPRDRPSQLRPAEIRRGEAGRRPGHLPRAKHQSGGVRPPGRNRAPTQDSRPDQRRGASHRHRCPGDANGPGRRRDRIARGAVALHAHAQRGRRSGGCGTLRATLRRLRPIAEAGRIRALVGGK